MLSQRQISFGNAPGYVSQTFLATCKILSPNRFLLLNCPQGYYRTERDKGSQYELFYKKADEMEYRHVSLFRPFGPLMKVKTETVDISRSMINIIVPLAGRTEVFAQFMQNFR